MGEGENAKEGDPRRADDGPARPAHPTGLVARLAALWDQIRARKVAQWSAAYVVLAFGLLQGLSFVRATFDWPNAIDRTALALAAAGLPMVLIVAWYHGDRGRQRVTRIEGGLLAACVALGAALVFLVLQPSQDDDHFTPSSLPRLAVLRFESQGATQPYFSETLADELISEASHINGLDVIARASSFALTGARATPAVAASELRANYVLTGSVASLEGQVRVNVQLAEAPSGRQVWSAQFERPTGEIYLLQDQIAANVARASGLRMSVRPPRRVKPEAYAAYVRGREAEQPATREAYRAAKTSYETAVAADPSFAQGWAALAQAAYAFAFDEWLHEPPGTSLREAAMADAVAAADRATALDAAMASPYETRARVMRALGRWSESLRAAEAARARGGVNASVVYLQLGYLDRAESLARRAAELDPLSATQITYVGILCESSGRFDCGIESSERAYRLAPDRGLYLWLYAQALASDGRTAEALQLTHTRPDLWREVLGLSRPMDMNMLRVTLGGPGERPSVQTLMQAYDRGDAYLDNIIEALLRTGQVRDIPPLLDRWTPGSALELLYHRDLAPVRASPQFWALMQREGILALWRQEGWPDFCAREPVCEAHRR